MDYLKLSQFFDKLEKTSKRLAKTNIVTNLIEDTSKNDLKAVIPLLRGKVFTDSSESKTGVNTKLVIKALASVVGTSTENIEKEWARKGDLGEVAEKLTTSKKQSTLFSKKLSVKKVFDNITKLSDQEGKGSVDLKVGLMKELLSLGSALENKFLVRLFLEDLRIGVGDTVMRDAIVWRHQNVNYEDGKINPDSREKYNQLQDSVQKAYDLTSDFVAIQETIQAKGFRGLEDLKLKPGTPINPMLAVKLDNADEAAKSVNLPCLVDYKLDGFRVEVHYDGKKIKLFTRRLEDVTKQFPDVIEVVKSKVLGKNFVLDAEIMGLDAKTKEHLPFQKISQRIRRKHKIEEMVKKLPVELQVFDILYYNNKSLIELPQKSRRELLTKIIPKVKNKLTYVTGTIAKTVKEIDKFYKEALSKGLEGIMVKSLNKQYTCGRKVGTWVKLKPVLENLDLTIVKAEWGTGKRAKWLSSFTVACKGKGKYLEVGKVSTGVKEKSDEGSYEQITKLLKPLIIKEEGKVVELKPKIVIEVSYEEIQKSPTYSSGFALRFPRVVHVRLDLKVPNSIDDVKRIFKTQR